MWPLNRPLVSWIDASFISELNAVNVIRARAAHKPHGPRSDRCLRIVQSATAVTSLITERSFTAVSSKFFSSRWVCCPPHIRA